MQTMTALIPNITSEIITLNEANNWTSMETMKAEYVIIYGKKE